MPKIPPHCLLKRSKVLREGSSRLSKPWSSRYLSIRFCSCPGFNRLSGGPLVSWRSASSAYTRCPHYGCWFVLLSWWAPEVCECTNSTGAEHMLSHGRNWADKRRVDDGLGR